MKIVIKRDFKTKFYIRNKNLEKWSEFKSCEFVQSFIKNKKKLNLILRLKECF